MSSSETSSSSSSSPSASAVVDLAASAGVDSAATEEELTLVVKWNGVEYFIKVCGDDTVGELKRRICEVTNVLPKRQKLLYPKASSKLTDDSLLLSQIPLKASLKMTMMGTTEDDIVVDPVESPEVIDDFEPGKHEDANVNAKRVNQQKLRRRIERYNIGVRNPCRNGKKLLVLDIDYTLFDHWSTAKNPLELMRPHLHEFLSATYAGYDIMIWSATSMRWIVIKMEQLGVLNNPNYKITALLDHMAMIRVQAGAYGVFDCKPLGLIWALFPEFYNAKNTIMLDDSTRNFSMNPQNGLTIKPYRNAHSSRSRDRELVRLTQYLLAIAELDDLSVLNHNQWEKFNEETLQRHRQV